MIDIVIPVYNEAKNIGPCLRAIHKHVTCDYTIWIVFDRDEDNTLPPATAVAKELNIKIKLHKNKYGCGALNAIKTGLEDATAKYIIVTMADLSDPPQVINNMIAIAETNELDLVCASRYMKGGQQIGGPALKCFLSKMAGLTLHWLAGIPTKDATNSFKLYTRKGLNQIQIESTGGFEIGLEIVVKSYLKGFKISEVPTTWTDRTNGESNFKLWTWLPLYLKWYFLAYKKRLLT